MVEQCNFGRPERAEHPMNCVSRGEASAYCNAVAGRLPGGEEWEYAVRAADQRRYPWGNEAASDGSYGNTADQSLLRRHAAESIGTERWYEPFDDGFAESSPVGSFPRDTSPFGLVDAAGNVSEWSQDTYVGEAISAESSAQAFTLGGGWLAGLARASHRNFRSERRRHPVVGFRCARDSPPLINP
jgi:formylglycine-generating enzyme required for sulfatase activity